MVGQTHKIPNLCDVGADKLVNFPANLVFDRQGEKTVCQSQRTPKVWDGGSGYLGRLHTFFDKIPHM